MRLPAPASKIVIGIDPGYDRLGWAIGQVTHRQFTVVECGCIQTNSRDSFNHRFTQLDRELSQLIDTFKPTQAAVENLYFSKNTKTAMKVSEARGLIVGCFLRNQIEVFHYDPNQIKLAVAGDGQATKQALAKMVKLQTQLTLADKIDDAIDAVAVGMTHALYYNPIAKY